MTPARRALAAAATAAVLLAACTGDERPAGRAPQEIEVRLGLVYTTSGLGADLASPVLGSVKLATDDAAKQKVKFTVTEVDYAGDLTKVAAAAEDLATKVDAIVVGTDAADIVPHLGTVTGVPVLHPFVTRDAAVDDDGNTFRFAPSNRLQAQRLAAFLVGHRKYNRIALLTDDTTFGAEGRRDMTAALGDAGITPVADQVFTPGGDIHTPVAAVAQRAAQAVVVWVESPGEASRIVVNAHKQGFAFQIVLSGNLASATFAKNATSQVAPVAFRDGMLSAGTWAGPWFRLERIVRFHREFRTQNSALAPVQAAAVYDSVMALAAAARSSGTSARQLIDGLEGLRDFEAAGVPVTFGPGKHDGLDLDDVAVYGFTKNQSAPGGEFAPEVDTGGGFFTVVYESLDLPDKYAYLRN